MPKMASEHTWRRDTILSEELTPCGALVITGHLVEDVQYMYIQTEQLSHHNNSVLRHSMEKHTALQ